MEDHDAARHVVLSGCSGGGKSTLLAELSRRGFRTVPEPGRRIVQEETAKGGQALPWVDLAAFARRAAAMARHDRTDLPGGAWIFFDRGVVDAVAALAHATGDPASFDLLRGDLRYHAQVFMTPPWPEIYAADVERRHGLADALAEYERLLSAYRDLGYETIVLPKIGVRERADFVLDRLG